MKTVPSTVFRQAIASEGFTLLLPALDKNINCPSRSWLKNDFSAYMKDAMMPGFEEAADCDEWAFFARVMASRSNGLSGSNVGVAFAIVWITIYESTFNGIPGPGLHVTNAVLLDDGTLIAYEPQTQTFADFKTAADRGDISLDCALY